MKKYCTYNEQFCFHDGVSSCEWHKDCGDCGYIVTIDATEKPRTVESDRTPCSGVY